MRAQSNPRGRCGEDYAARWLERQGCRVLERNWRCPEGEVDIIVLSGELICFVEVKTRLPDSYGPPPEAVDRRKRRRLARCAERYLFLHPGCGAFQPRFDVAGVLLGAGENPPILSFSYLPGAFTCDDL